MKQLFLSDLHLSEQAPSIKVFFDLFIEHATANKAEIESIYILGDFFEFWIGDDYKTPFTEGIFSQLKSLSESGIKTYFMHGNRDFLIREGFEKDTGFQVISDPYLITLDDEKVILSHGDQLCTDDSKYQEFRALVRNPQWQEHFLSQTLENRWKMALEARKESMQSQEGQTDYAEEKITDVNQDAVESLLFENQSLCLIHGHTHRPNTHLFQLKQHKAKRMVLAAWYKEGSFLSYDSKSNEFETIVLK